MLTGNSTTPDAVLREICLGISSAIGEEFFCYLLCHVASAAGAEAGLIYRHTGKEADSGETLAAMVNGDLIENFIFTADGISCDDYLKSGMPKASGEDSDSNKWYFNTGENGVTQIGLPLVDYSGTAMGGISLYGKKGRINVDLAESLLNIFSLRISAELERENAIRAQAEQIHLLQEILNAIPHPVFYKNRDGRYLGCNERYEHFLGIKRHEILEKKISDLLPHRVAAMYVAQDQDIFERGGARILETVFEIKEGDRRDVILSKAAFSTPGKGFEGVVGTIMDVTQMKKAEREIYNLANYDLLTALPNRTQFLQRLDQSLSDAQRQRRILAVLVVDFDNFKAVNESWGHAACNEMIRLIGKRFKRCCRKGDIVARTGGDRFAIAVNSLKIEEDAAFVARRILKLVSKPIRIFNKEVHCQGSVGIALYPSSGYGAETLLKHAETAMYQSKKNGRAGFKFHNEEMNRNAEERLVLEASLRGAIKRGELLLHYQPQVDLTSGEMVGVEALIRWEHPEKGLVSPMSFIPLAEETGLILPIGDWVIRTACLQNRQWQEAGYPPVRMAVNVSAHQLRAPHFAENVVAILEETGLEGRWLEFELTETVIMTNHDEIIALLHTFRDLGISISIDDFGTGYSSLEYLKRFPIDKVKMDRSYVKDIPSASSDIVIAEAIIAMASGLGLKVLAEGVETREQVEFLKARKCDKSQGYFFAKPMPAENIEELFGKDLETRSIAMAS